MPVTVPLPDGPFTPKTGTPGPDVADIVKFLTQKGTATDTEVQTAAVTEARTSASATYVPKVRALVGGTATAGVGVDVYEVTTETHPGTWRSRADTGSVFTGNGESHFDPIGRIGWQRKDTTVPTNAILFEADYWTNQGGTWHHQSEQYSMWDSPTHGQIRPWGWSAHWNTGFIDLSFQVSEFTVRDVDGFTNRLKVAKRGQLLLEGSETTRVGVGGPGTVLVGRNLAWDTVSSAYQAVGTDGLSGVVAGDGVVDFYAAPVQTAGTAQTRKARLNGVGDLELVGNLKAAKLLIGPNGLEWRQEGFAMATPGDLLAQGRLTAGPAPLSSQFAVTPATNGRVGQTVAPFSAAQTASLAEYVNAASLPVTEVLPLGTLCATDASKGIVRRSPDGAFWRETIDNLGARVMTSLGAIKPTS